MSCIQNHPKSRSFKISLPVGLRLTSVCRAPASPAHRPGIPCFVRKPKHRRSNSFLTTPDSLENQTCGLWIIATCNMFQLDFHPFRTLAHPHLCQRSMYFVMAMTTPDAMAVTIVVSMLSMSIAVTASMIIMTTMIALIVTFQNKWTNAMSSKLEKNMRTFSNNYW